MGASSELSLVQQLKISLFAHGIHITPAAQRVLTRDGAVPLTTHEYHTTDGVTLILPDSVYVNAPFDDPFCSHPEAALSATGDGPGFAVEYGGHEVPAQALPLPGYVDAKSAAGHPIADIVYSHADRIRLSPAFGCTFSCQFCDFPGRRYGKHALENILEAFDIAREDDALSPSHVLISGGTPGPLDYRYFDDVCAAVVRHSELPVDVMMPPRPRDPAFIDRLVDIGIDGFAINLEVFAPEIARTVIREKYRLGHALFQDTISRAVERTGGSGRVRSLILVGLEPEEKTLEGLEFLARLGCDPVLSPFRPSIGTELVHHHPPEQALLERVFLRATEIVERYGVKLGPRCIPCQHNTLSFPDTSGAYYYSGDRAPLL